MKRLIEGYRKFRKTLWPAERANYERLSKKGQRPEYLIVACSDSRSGPALIFDEHPGEFFVVRNVAAIVPPYEAQAGYLDVDGARFGITNGVLEVLNKENARFESADRRAFPFNLIHSAA